MGHNAEVYARWYARNRDKKVEQARNRKKAARRLSELGSLDDRLDEATG